MGVSENTGYLIGGPYSKDPTIWGLVLRVPCFRKPPFGISGFGLGIFC